VSRDTAWRYSSERVIHQLVLEPECGVLRRGRHTCALGRLHYLIAHCFFPSGNTATPQHEESSWELAVFFGAVDYLLKPADADDIISTVWGIARPVHVRMLEL
jgi:hypothetical protein